MKELSKILELLEALQKERQRAPQRPLPGFRTAGGSQMPAFQAFAAAAQQYHTPLCLWAFGQYRHVATPPQVQQMVDAFLRNCSYAALCRRPMSHLPTFEALQKQMRAFIDGELDSYTEK